MDSNLNEQQPIPIPNQEIPTPNTSPTPKENKPKIKKVIIILTILLFIITAGTLIYVFFVKDVIKKVETSLKDKNVSITNGDTTQKEPVSTESAFGKLAGKTSDNYSECDNPQCLIEAAENCEPVKVTVSYSGLSNPLAEGVVFSGQAVYEIVKTDEDRICSLYMSNPVSTIDFTEEFRQEMIAEGATDEEIIEGVKYLNEGMDSNILTQVKNICTADGNLIAEFLSDYVEDNTSAESTPEGIVYTTSSGKILECVTELPPRQMANTTSQITSEGCMAKNGYPMFVEENGEACFVGGTDLGRIVDDNITVNPAQQCCLEK
jgi:hypothetical protein